MPLLRERLLPSSVIYTSRAAGGVYSGELFPAGINLPGQTHVGSKAGLNMAIPESFADCPSCWFAMKVQTLERLLVLKQQADILRSRIAALMTNRDKSDVTCVK